MCDDNENEDVQAVPCPSCGGNPSEDECTNCGGDGWVEN